jgi:hypothetical protein
MEDANAPKIPELVEVSGHSYGKPRPVRVVVDLAAAQDGVVGYEQLVALGVSGDWIEHRVLHNLRRTSTAVIHVTAPPGGREDRDGIVIHRVRNMRDAEKAVVDGIPVTSVARTILDMAATVRRDVLDQILEASEKNGSFDLRAFHAVGGLLEHQIAIEIDGGAVHGTALAKQRDPERDTRLQLAGYEVLRVPEQRLVHAPAAFIDDVRKFLSRAARTPARPGR